jgi:predicted ferric reductase
MRNSTNEQWLFYANQTKDSAVFGKTLQEKLGNRSISILSSESSVANTNDERGYVTPSLFQKYLAKPNSYTYFICGPKKMMDVTKESLIEIGIPASQIFSEEFSF